VYYLPNCGTSADNLKAHERARAIPQAEVRKEFGLPDGPIIFYYGHFEPGDDFVMFCRVATPAAERSGAAIVFVGEGPELKNVKQCFVQRPAVKVLFFPRLSYDAFVRLIWASDVTAFPYPDDPVHRSKCSLRVIDYMAMGKPVITSAVGQNNEYIVDGESGILVPPGDDHAFTSKLELLLQHPSLRQQIGDQAAQRIRDNFTWGGQALTQCLAAYDQVANCV
jgi:glycosyltransferase involved in cell wall biosynthesis